MKPLTLEELKALPIGEGVRIKVPEFADGQYIYFQKFLDDEKVGCMAGKTVIMPGIFHYDTYGKDWVAYSDEEPPAGKGRKNK